MERLPRETDVFVIGGGPAGLAAAIAARRRGFKVLVADGGRPPIDKACGEGLMPDALAALAALGIDPSRYGFPFRGIRFVEDGSSAEASFPGCHGIGIRRPVLHRLLIERAAAEGVDLRWATPVRGLEDGAVRAGAEWIRCRWTVGADGQHSRVRRWAGLDSPLEVTERVGIRRHFRIKPWTDYVEVHWGDGYQAYVTPVAAEEVCIALVGAVSEVSIDDLPALFPALGRRLMNAQPTSAIRGAISASRRLTRATRGAVALVGDASGSVDAISGEGLGLAFRQAAALSEAMVREDLGLYEAVHRRICRMPQFMARLMLALGARAGLRRRALGVLSGNPRIFNRLLAAHVGVARPAAASLDLAGFACRMLLAGLGQARNSF